MRATTKFCMEQFLQEFELGKGLVLTFRFFFIIIASFTLFRAIIILHDLLEEEVCRVILIHLKLDFSCFWTLNLLIEKFDQHR